MLVTHPVFRAAAWGALHPLAGARQAAVLELAEALGWLPVEAVATCSIATEDDLAAFHDHAYIAALRRASEGAGVSAEERARYGFGTMENPIFPGVYERAAASVGGAIEAARRALAGETAFHPAGGTHHGRRDRASGFCYFNDPVFAILTLLGAGVDRVLYLDLDAHHGDGVQDAFVEDPRVFVVSIHEEARWPHTGAISDRAGGNARNIPVPPGFNDSELAFLMAQAVKPLAERVAPQAVVIVAGADCLAGDPLSGMALSNGAFWRAVEDACGLAPVRVVLGGGGYNPWTTARAWAGLWGRLAGFPAPDALPQAARGVLAALACDLIDDDEIDPDWLKRLEDAPRPGEVRPALRAAAVAACAP